MLSPILFTLYTDDCSKVHPNNFISKFADDRAIVSLLHKDMDPFVYHNEINTAIMRCDRNHLILNMAKTQQMVLVTHKPAVIKDQTINQVDMYSTNN